jgi:hypothetical protein
MGESLAPSSTHRGAAAPERARIEIGMLRNGLGSIRNLELLIKSIKVGQKGLFAAVAAVHADCAPMIANAVGLAQALADAGVEHACAERLSSALSTSLTDLENMLSVAVQAGRLSVAQRLRLERDLARCARELGSTLPLVGLIERASRPPPAELTPADLIYASSAERADQKSVSVERSLLPEASQVGLRVDLEAAKMLVALGVALVMEGHFLERRARDGRGRDGHDDDDEGDGPWLDAPSLGNSLEGTAEVRPRLGFEVQPDGALATTVKLGPATSALGTATSGAASALGQERARVRIAALRISSSSVMCAEVAARSLGARFEYDRDAHRVCIYWPLS